MPNNTDILLQLRDIHMPPGVSIWPLAPGWILLLMALGASIIGAIIYFTTYYVKKCKRDFALHRLQEIKEMAKQSRYQAIGELSILLRRVALSTYPRKSVAGLTNQEWLEFLDHKGATTAFTNEFGELLSQIAYGKSKITIDKTQFNKLFTMTQQWIIRNV